MFFLLVMNEFRSPVIVFSDISFRKIWFSTAGSKPIDRSNGLTGFLGWVISNEVNIFCCSSHGQTRNTETERRLSGEATSKNRLFLEQH